MAMLTQAMTTTVILVEDPYRMEFIWVNKQLDLIAHIFIPPPHANVNTIEASDFQMEEVIMINPTKDTTKELTTLGLKKVFK